MKRIIFFPIILLAALLLSSCSKDKQLGHWLERKGGKWTIATYDVVELENGVQVDHDTANDAGTFTFDNGTITIQLMYSNAVTSYSGKYTVGSKIISFDVNGVTKILNVEESSKTKLKLTTTETYAFGQDTYVNNITYVLQR